MLGDCMKVEFLSENNLAIFLNTLYLKQFSKDDDEIESYLKHLFKLLKRSYGIDLNGYYQISVFIEKYYGTILLIEKEDLEYYDYFDNQIDMCIQIKEDQTILYQIDDFFSLPSEIQKCARLFLYKEKQYIGLNQIISDALMGLLLEHSQIEFQQTDTILTYGEPIVFSHL